MNIEAFLKALDTLPPKVPKGILIAYTKALLKGDVYIPPERVIESVPKNLREMGRFQAKDYLTTLTTYQKFLGLRGTVPTDVAVAMTLFETFSNVDRPRSARFIRRRLSKISSDPAMAYKRLYKFVESPLSGFIVPRIPVERGVGTALLYMKLDDLNLVKDTSEKGKMATSEVINVEEFIESIKRKYDYLITKNGIPMGVLRAVILYELSTFKDWGINLMIDVEFIKEQAKKFAERKRNFYISIQNGIRRLGDVNIITKVAEHLPIVEREYGNPAPAEVIVDWAVTEFGVHWDDRLVSMAYDSVLTYYRNGMVGIADYSTIKGTYQPSPVELTAITLTAKMKLESYIKENGFDGVEDFIAKAKEQGEKWARHVRHVSKTGKVVVRVGSKVVKFQLDV
ncbi:protein of unknown function (plasmid) [Thermococcus nautili]|uniref:hypothetical protein n=1 Tax=Thermococcus nautili TaxID=195522 RepID=UPI00255217C1|nr:hypothetical protein [Thermococcus nautili]CAI1494199.1 protein of unknown function [Thermococcus nautili]